MRGRSSGGAITARQQVLARRRLALIVLGAAVPLTLILALITGSTLLLFLNLAVDVALAGYIAMLLQIKQAQQGGRPLPPHGTDEEVRVL